MKKRLTHLLSASCVVIMVFALMAVSDTARTVYADSNEDHSLIVVSLGDSYSSGEGIEPFYGQEDGAQKIFNNDWLAHRSRKSWPGLLKVPGKMGAEMGATLSNYKDDEENREGNLFPDQYNCKWYFVASSGATTAHFSREEQEKHAKYQGMSNHHKKLPKQMDIFNDIEGSVDYVTLTVGGNDVDFSDVITRAAVGSSYLHHHGFISGKNYLIEKKMNDLWGNIETTKTDIKNVYTGIKEKAPEAEIIVAGYPELLDRNGKGFVISRQEANKIDDNVWAFDGVIYDLVEECRQAGMRIHYVDVREEFNKDGGHQAYSDHPWINEIMWGAQAEDLTGFINAKPASSYSIHPNEEGAKAYAKCVNAKIEEIEKDRETEMKSQYGPFAGKVCKASDRSAPVPAAQVLVYDSKGELYTTLITDSDGEYHAELPVDVYHVVVKATGYLDFSAYASVVDYYHYTNRMETFLLIEGSEKENGTASGTIYNALTGKGVEGVSLSVRRGWNNEIAETGINGILKKTLSAIKSSDYGKEIASTTTDADGRYSLTLPLGNYTIVPKKNGFISVPVNIIVQKGTTDSQNGTITPILVSGEEFRIVLTWGENPADLDSHVEGKFSNESPFHVYYSFKSANDGEQEVCNLDVDNRSGHGPETITLNTNTGNPYYYYVYRYSGSGSIATSEAKVDVYQGQDLVASFNAPTDQGSGDYWNVFSVVNGELVVMDTVSESANTSYADSVGKH